MWFSSSIGSATSTETTATLHSASTPRAKGKIPKSVQGDLKSQPSWPVPLSHQLHSGVRRKPIGRKSLPDTKLSRDDGANNIGLSSSRVTGQEQHPPLPVDPNSPFPPCPAHLAAHPLPVRLGVVPDPILGGPSEDHTPRFSDGYYFYLPPPTQVDRMGTSRSNGHSGGVRIAPAVSPTTSTFAAKRRTSFSAVSLSALNLTKTNSGGSSHRVPGGDSAVSSSLSLSSTATANPAYPGAVGGGSSFWSRGAGKFSSNTSDTSAPPTPSLTPSATTNDSCSSVSESRTSSIAGMPQPAPTWHPSQYFTSTTSICQGKSSVRRQHAYPPDEVPYWFGYDMDTLNAEMWLYQYSSKQSGLDTFVPWKTPPKRVLDLGSGLGIWCLDTAAKWKSTEFIGMDVVPIQTPVSSQGDPDVSSRVSWVVANFLQTFPFPDASFDFVRCRGNSPAVPEDEWSSLLSEITRVLTPGGYVEIIDANYTFFGMPRSILLADAIALANGKNIGETEALFGKAAKDTTREDALTRRRRRSYLAVQTVYERMFHRRFINMTPLSILPAQLLMQGLSNVGLATPRRIPLPARPWRETVGTSSETGTAGGADINAPCDGGAMKSKSNIELRKFVFANQDEARSVSIVQLVWYLKGARDIVWEEAEAEKRKLLRAKKTSASSASGCPINDSGEVDNDMYSHPWECKAEFEEALDSWAADLLRRSDLGALVTDLVGWNDGSAELQQTYVKGGRDGKLPPHYSKALPLSPAALPSSPSAADRGLHRDTARDMGDGDHQKRSHAPLSDLPMQANINTAITPAVSTSKPQRPPLPARDSSYHREADARKARAEASPPNGTASPSISFTASISPASSPSTSPTLTLSTLPQESPQPAVHGERIEILGFRDVSVFIACNP